MRGSGGGEWRGCYVVLLLLIGTAWFRWFSTSEVGSVVGWVDDWILDREIDSMVLLVCMYVMDVLI